MPFFWLALASLLGMWLIAVHNLIAFPRLSARKTPRTLANLPPVSILVPARNEVKVVQETLRQLLAQDYPEFELLLLDDDSSDGTAQVAMATAGSDSRFRLIQGTPPPQGWTGKNWACHQLSTLAKHSVLLFTDADVEWQPGSLAAVVAQFQESEADLLSVWPTQVTVGWMERLVVPLMALAVWSYLPISLVHRSAYASAATANGQCMVFRRRAYGQIGGHSSVAQSVLDDVVLSRRVKQLGHNLRLADAAGLLSCRMYRGSRQVFAGFRKNILAGHGNQPLWLLLSMFFHLFLFVVPWVWLPVATRARKPAAAASALLLIVLGIGVRALTAAATRQRIRDAVWMPFSVFVMTAISASALWGHWRKQAPEWKGRRIPDPRPVKL